MKLPKHWTTKKHIYTILLTLLILGVFSLLTIVIAKNFVSSESNHKDDVILQLPDDYAEDIIAANKITFNDSKSDGFLYQSHENGTCTLVGVSDTTAIEIHRPSENPLGEKVIKIGARAFNDCDMATSVYIPATVKEIAPDAFLECNNLVAIMTSSSNTKFCSVGGILFSKDKSVLICYPANRVGNSYLISVNIQKISDHAFYQINNLEKIFYEESVEAFSKIQIGAGNKSFQELQITCNYVAGKK